MNKVKVPADGSLDAAIEQFRGNSNDNEERYLAVGYEDKNTLKVIGQGVGGLEEVKPLLVPDQCVYVLLRKSHKVELAMTVKFAFVDWTPSTLKPMRKGLLSTHKGQVQDLLKPYHVSLQASSPDELDEGTIMKMIGFGSGTASHVVSKQKARAIEKELESKKPKQTKTSTGAKFSSSVTAVRQLEVTDEAACKAALASVRDDNSDTTWAIIGYENPKTLHLVSSGTGGVENLSAALQAADDGVYYSLFRHTEAYDKSERVLFGFVKLLSDKLSPMVKAKYSTHSGFVSTLFDPYHVDFIIHSPDELSVDAVHEKCLRLIGKSSKIVGASAQTTHVIQPGTDRPKPKPKAKPANLVPTSTAAAIQFEDEDAFKAAIAAVRADSDPTTWFVAKAIGHSKLGVLGTGTTGADDMIQLFEEKNVDFGFLRVTDVIDKSVTVKFVYVKWQPQNISPMTKAKLSTKKGQIDALFAPYHVDFFVESKDEISSDKIDHQVSITSGSKSRVTSNAASGALNLH